MLNHSMKVESYAKLIRLIAADLSLGIVSVDWVGGGTVKIRISRQGEQRWIDLVIDEALIEATESMGGFCREFIDPVDDDFAELADELLRDISEVIAMDDFHRIPGFSYGDRFEGSS